MKARAFPFSISHFSSHFSLGVVDFLFVFVRVISWIVLISRKANDPTKEHESPRNEIQEMNH